MKFELKILVIKAYNSYLDVKRSCRRSCNMTRYFYKFGFNFVI